jgi:hypothetical protein
MPPLSAVSTHSSSGASVESVEQPWWPTARGFLAVVLSVIMSASIVHPQTLVPHLLNRVA